MTENFLPPTSTIPISTKGQMEPAFSRWTEQVSQRITILGEGNPEGSVDAVQGASYIDTTGTTGSILYVKRDADISSDTTQGWILV